jgi:hypothetical protein
MQWVGGLLQFLSKEVQKKPKALLLIETEGDIYQRPRA